MSTRALLALHHLERLDAGAGLQHLVALARQRAGGEVAHHVLVLDQQHAARAGEVARGSPSSSRAAGGDLVLVLDDVARQVDAEGGALADLAVGEDVAAGLLDDAVDGGEAEARYPCRPPWWRRTARRSWPSPRASCRRRCPPPRSARIRRRRRRSPTSFRLSRSLTLRVRMVRQPPSGMASRALTARLMMTCSNCVLSALTYQRSRPDRILSSIFSPKARLRRAREVGQHLAELQHLRPAASAGARRRAAGAPGRRRGWRCS